MTAPVDSQWYPECYLDECMPAGRASASAWIVEIDGAPHLAGDRFNGEGASPLTDGQIVRFFRCDTFDTIEMTLTDDGYSFAQEPPTDFEQCCILGGWQGDTLATCVEEMVALLRETEAEPGDYAASFYTYVDTGPWRFVAASRTFEQVQS